MKTTTFARTLGLALLAALSAALMAACGGGGDADGEAVGAVAPSSKPEAASQHALRAPMGGGRLAPICTFITPDCPPKQPPTQ